MAITSLSLPSALGANFNNGDVSYLTASDPVYFDNTNRPHRNMAFRDTLVNNKLSEVIVQLNDMIGGAAIVAGSDLAHNSAPSTLQDFMKASHNADGTIKASALPSLSAASVDAAALETLTGRPLYETIAMGNRGSTMSGFFAVPIVGSGDPGDLVPSYSGSNATLTIKSNTVQMMGHRVFFDDQTITLPAPPASTSAARQDLVILEAWREIAHPLRSAQSSNAVTSTQQVIYQGVDLTSTIQINDFVDCLNGEYYQITNVTYSGGNTVCSLKLPVVTAISTPSSTRILKGTPRFYRYGVVGNLNAWTGDVTKVVSTVNGDFRYETGGKSVCTDPYHSQNGVIGLHGSGAWWQLRLRFATYSDVNVAPVGTNIHPNAHDANTYIGVGRVSNLPLTAQGPAAAPLASLNLCASINTTSHANYGDIGLFCEVTGSATSLQNGALPFTSDGVCHLALPVAFLHRRNSLAWSLANMNGGATNTSPGRPDGFSLALDTTEILDLRHRIYDGAVDTRAVYEETLQALLSDTLATNWEPYLVDPDGDGTFDVSLNIYSTRPLRIDAVGTPDSTWRATKTKSANGLVNTPDSVRNYYSDAPGVQSVVGVISAPTSTDVVRPTPIFAYDHTIYTLTITVTNMAAYLGAPSSRYRPQLSGRLPELSWSGRCSYMDSAVPAGITAQIAWPNPYGRGIVPKVRAKFSAYAGDTITAEIQQKTPVVIHCSSANAPTAVGDVYTAANSVSCTVTGKMLYSGYFTVEFAGTTVPTAGTWNRTSGAGSSTLAVDYLGPLGWNCPPTSENPWGTTVERYEGEGYDLHASDSVFLQAFVEFKEGSGLLARTPWSSGSRHDGLDGIVACQFYKNVSGTNYQMLPNNGFGFVPYLSSAEDAAWNSATSGGPSSASLHNRTTILSGFRTLSPVLNTGATVYDTVAVSSPCVIKDGTTFKMWYSAWDGVNYRILYSTSTDGVTWATPVLALNKGAAGSGDDANAAAHPCVIKDGSTYHIWYTGVDGSSISRIIHATSSNPGSSGATWSGFARAISPNSDNVTLYGDVSRTAKPLDFNGVGSPWVIKDGSTFKCWYTGYNSTHYAGKQSLLYCTSSDGTTWTGYSPVIRPLTPDNTGESIPMENQLYNAHARVIKETNSGVDYYRMVAFNGWYDAWGSYTDQHTVYFSRDGKTWSYGQALQVNVGGPAGSVAIPPCFIKEAIGPSGATPWRYIGWGNAYDVDTGKWGIYCHVLTCTDGNANASGSDTSVVGVYATQGLLNCALTANDTALIFYKTSARQRDFSWFSGNLTVGTGQLDYTLLYLPNTCYLSTLGTALDPYAFPRGYRHAFHNLCLNNNTNTLNQRLYELTAAGIDIDNYIVRSADYDQFPMTTLSGRIPYTLGRPLGSVFPNGDACASLLSGSRVLAFGFSSARTGFTENAATVVASSPGVSILGNYDINVGFGGPKYTIEGYHNNGDPRVLLMLGALGKHPYGELMMPMSVGLYDSSSSNELPVAVVTPVGRPILTGIRTPANVAGSGGGDIIVGG